jgi:hypothetical protein
MRTYDEYRKILELWERGENKCEIERQTGIPRGTVVDCIKRFRSIKGLEENRERASKSTPDEVLERIRDPLDIQTQQAYAYVLGIYLGDGYIVRNKRVFYLRIALDNDYPNIINTCVQNVQNLLPDNKVNVVRSKQGDWSEVVCTYKFWPDLFPQHGAGSKHLREIRLEEWQLQIVDRYPLEFFKGLYHSDGCRETNIVKGKNYPRYAFTNFSQDIRQLFCYTCNLLGLHWTVASNGRNINIAKRLDVEYLDRVVGPKS